MPIITSPRGHFLQLQVPGQPAAVLLTSAEVQQLRHELGVCPVQQPHGTELRDTPSCKLELEMLHRAITRTDAAIARAQETLRVLNNKRGRQHDEWERLSQRLAAETKLLKVQNQ